MDALELFPNVDLGARPPDGGACRAPIGQQRARRPRVRRVRPSSVRLLSEIRGLIEHQHAEVIAELRVLRQQRRDEYEIPTALLRRLTEIERHLGVIETPADAAHQPPAAAGLKEEKSQCPKQTHLPVPRALRCGEQIAPRLFLQ